MDRHNILISLTFAAYLLLGGCGSTEKNAIAGGVVGGGVGAGTGALIGSSIANGDVAMSALAGGAIGVPVGIALGVALTAWDTEAQEDILLKQYRYNQDIINEREAEIQRLREEVLNDKPALRVDDADKERLFHGATLGSPM